MGLTASEFSGNRILCLAVKRLFINLGEAAYRVGDERAGAMRDIPWLRIIGLRNLLAQGYEPTEGVSPLRPHRCRVRCAT